MFFFLFFFVILCFVFFLGVCVFFLYCFFRIQLFTSSQFACLDHLMFLKLLAIFINYNYSATSIFILF